MENWRDYRLRFDQEASDLIGRMTLEEKAGLLSGHFDKKGVRNAILRRSQGHYNEEPYTAGGCEKYGIEEIRFVDGSRGVVCGNGKAVCFPVAAMRAASFDPELEEQIGRAIGEEVLAAGGNLFGGICVNVPYHPGWGRSQETYGEDTFLIGEMAAAMVRGISSTGVIACVKHFAFNSMENIRLTVNVECTPETEQEVFLAQFRRCIEAGAGAVMTSYNRFRGEYCSENAHLIREVLKEQWSFDGFTVSDFNWGIHDGIKALRAGLDLEMPNTVYYGEALIRAVRRGDLSEKLVDDAAKRIVRTVLAHREYRRRHPAKPVPGDVFYTSVHIRLARECAERSITLLRNENHVLPIRKLNRESTLVVLGRLADEANTGDHGSSQVFSPYVATPLDAILRAAGDAEVIWYAGTSEAHCRRLARTADYVLIFAGLDFRGEGEYIVPDEEDAENVMPGGDRTGDIGLPAEDLRCINAVAEVRSDAVVILQGTCFSAGEWREKTGAIVHMYYAGMEGGNAIANVLFGNVNPGGKLPFAMPVSSADLQQLDWTSEEQFYGRRHGYTYLEGTGTAPAYPFGFGLSYTKFSLGVPGLRKTGEGMEAAVAVRNTGGLAGSTVIQLYAGKDAGEAGTITGLCGFRRVFLEPGEEQEVRIPCPREADPRYGRLHYRIGTSSAPQDLMPLEMPE